MPCRLQAEELDVQHMRNPGQGVPIAGIGRSQRPGQAFNGQAILNRFIFIHIDGVIIGDEFAMTHLPEEHPRGQRKKKADDEDASTIKKRFI